MKRSATYTAVLLAVLCCTSNAGADMLDPVTGQGPTNPGPLGLTNVYSTRVLHLFTGSLIDPTYDGKAAYGNLIEDSSGNYFGMSSLGGIAPTAGGGNAGGVVFKIDNTGKFSPLVVFNDNMANSSSFSPNSVAPNQVVLGDGGQPTGSLLLSGTKLFGMTQYGGNQDSGIIFSYDLVSKAYVVLHNFTGGSDGGNPYGSLTLSGDGSTLYGMTHAGGSASSPAGTVFSVSTGGASFTTMHSFNSSNRDGAAPTGDLTFYNGTLYGMTPAGGQNSHGTIFSINTTDGGNGTYGYTQMYSFATTNAQNVTGADPQGDLTVVGNRLYGMTLHGGNDGAGHIAQGTIVSFSAPASGNTISSLNLLHTFLGASKNDGANPLGNLTAVGAMLWGMTSAGGGSSSSNYGTVFSINVSDPNINNEKATYAVLHSFGPPTGASDGSGPKGSLTAAVNAQGQVTGLVGMTASGGVGQMGLVFVIPEPSTFALLGFVVANLIFVGCWRRRHAWRQRT
jgi:uncharacterized repeat protein (TIGR03803 family)